MIRRFKSLGLAAIAMLAEKNDATMAAPADISPDTTSQLATTDDIRVQLNNVIASLRLLTAKLDADAGVTDVNYSALIIDAAIATAPKKIKAV